MAKLQFLAIACACGSAMPAWAQPAPELPMPPPFVLMRGEDAFEGQTVRALPYTARTETELVQMLADGNRISGRWTGLVARDGEGRVRREQPLAAIGPLLAGPGAPRLTVIVDPVKRLTWFLDADTKTARRMVWPADGSGHDHPGRFWPPPGERSASVESLGGREIAGVAAQGTRSTYLIPAGRIGNDRPLSVVSESWSSAELQVVLETRHADPRFGETRFRLIDLQQGEPQPALFQVPAGYAVEDGPPRLSPPPGLPGASAPKDGPG